MKSASEIDESLTFMWSESQKERRKGVNLKSTQKKKKTRKKFESRERKMTPYHSGKIIQMTADFSSKPMKARRKWYNIFQVLKGKNWQHKIYIHQNYQPGMKGKSRHPQMKKTKRICHQNAYCKRKEKEKRKLKELL